MYVIVARLYKNAFHFESVSVLLLSSRWIQFLINSKNARWIALMLQVLAALKKESRINHQIPRLEKFSFQRNCQT